LSFGEVVFLQLVPSQEEHSRLCPGIDCMQKMQEQFSAYVTIEIVRTGGKEPVRCLNYLFTVP